MKDVAAIIILLIYFLVQEFYENERRLSYDHTFLYFLALEFYEIKDVSAIIILLFEGVS